MLIRRGYMAILPTKYGAYKYFRLFKTPRGVSFSFTADETRGTIYSNPNRLQHDISVYLENVSTVNKYDIKIKKINLSVEDEVENVHYYVVKSQLNQEDKIIGLYKDYVDAVSVLWREYGGDSEARGSKKNRPCYLIKPVVCKEKDVEFTPVDNVVDYGTEEIIIPNEELGGIF